MVIVVEGFMSRIGALQFEWAWQHGKESRHIESDAAAPCNSAGTPELDINVKPKTGKPKSRRRSSRPRSLAAHLANLHLLLRSTYFSRWPLTVRFFSPDAHRVWQVWSERVDGFLPDHIGIVLDGDCGHEDVQPNRNNTRVGSIQQIQAGYTNIQSYLEKAIFLLDDPQGLCCRICGAPVLPKNEPIVVCPQENCHCMSHLTCLSKIFLNETGDPGQFVPTHGSCPACKEIVQWPLIMKELSLRSRGGKELHAVLRKKRKGKDDGDSAAPGKGDFDGRSSIVEPTPDNHLETREPLWGHSVEESELDDDWTEGLDMESDSDADTRVKESSKGHPSRLEIVIEDSEEDDLEILDV